MKRCLPEKLIRGWVLKAFTGAGQVDICLAHTKIPYSQKKNSLNLFVQFGHRQPVLAKVVNCSWNLSSLTLAEVQPF